MSFLNSRPHASIWQIFFAIWIFKKKKYFLKKFVLPKMCIYDNICIFEYIYIFHKKWKKNIFFWKIFFSPKFFCWHGSFRECNFRTGTILGKGFPEALVHTVHSTRAFGTRAVNSMHLCFRKTLSQNCPCAEIRHFCTSESSTCLFVPMAKIVSTLRCLLKEHAKTGPIKSSGWKNRWVFCLH